MSGKQVPDRMLAHAARAKGTCDDFSVCRAFWSFWAPKGHDRATAGKIYDNRLRVSCIKEYNRLFNVLSVLKRYSPYSLQVNRYGWGYKFYMTTRIQYNKSCWKLAFSHFDDRRRVVEGFARKNILCTFLRSLTRGSGWHCLYFSRTCHPDRA